MRGSSKMAWTDAICTTRYPLILMLCCDVFIFVVKRVPCDEDLEWPYPSCLFMEKSFLELFARSQSRGINGRSPNPFTWRWQFVLLAETKKTNKQTKNKKSSSRVCGRVYFCVQWCKVGLHNAMARIDLAINSSGDILLGKEKALLLQ